jgi:hypothetical protein
MEQFDARYHSFARFETAAAKGHEESIWVTSVVKDVEMEENFLREAFAMTEEPLGWWFAGRLSEEGSREQFDFFKKSAEGGCSWGQVQYALDFRNGWNLEKDEKVYVEWLEKSAKQNNPEAMDWLGHWFQYEGGETEKAVSYYRTASALGWEESIIWLAGMLRDGEGCAKDLRHAAMWSAKAKMPMFWFPLQDAKRALESRATDKLDCDFDQLCYALGWGLFWHQYGSELWNRRSDVQVFGNRCLDFYCSCVELQQKSIFTFLLCWNRTTGVKGPRQMIAQMVWEGREDNLVKVFELKDEGWGCVLF